MAGSEPHRVKTITEFHRLTGLAGPLHPLISVVDYAQVRIPTEYHGIGTVFDFYSISIKRGLSFKLIYGQQPYDFDEGIMSFLSPGQVLRVELEQGDLSASSGWLLLIHPDFLRNTSLSETIRHYTYFGYTANEALFLSEREEKRINEIIGHINEECLGYTDRFSQGIIVAHLEALLGNADRFYNRQFVTRAVTNNKMLARLEKILDDYFETGDCLNHGLPSVAYVAERLNVSGNYLSGLLKSLTGLNTQQHIHEKLIEAAKLKLSTTDLTISEIAYSFGFEHLPSFSKFFKQKTGISPVFYRQGFQH